MGRRMERFLPGAVLVIALGCGTTQQASGGAIADAGGKSDAADAAAPGDAAAPDGSAAVDGADAAAGSDTSSPDSGAKPSPAACPPVLASPQLGLHGAPCTEDAACAYGHCERGGFLTGYNNGIGYCTKDCGCSAPSAQCSDDNAGGVEFVCAFELSASGGNPKAGSSPLKRCGRRCLKDAECLAANPALPHCITSGSYVSSAGVCGLDPAH